MKFWLKGEAWQSVEKRLVVIRLSHVARVLVPGLWVSTIQQRTRAASYEGGRSGLLVGGLLVVGAGVIGALLFPTAGVFGLALALWLLGGTGAVMVANSIRPIAFVKPICVDCRLLPVITEHEAIHISGVEDDAEVWSSMKTRHSVESLKLVGDSTICTFCPILKRLGEQ